MVNIKDGNWFAIHNWLSLDPNQVMTEDNQLVQECGKWSQNYKTSDIHHISSSDDSGSNITLQEWMLEWNEMRYQ